jgi:hypothetical protein
VALLHLAGMKKGLEADRSKSFACLLLLCQREPQNKVVPLGFECKTNAMDLYGTRRWMRGNPLCSSPFHAPWLQRTLTIRRFDPDESFFVVKQNENTEVRS